MQRGITSQAVKAKPEAGGNAGSVGGGVVGGDGGTIKVSSAGSIITVQDFADGGSGGDQAGQGGAGGQAAAKGQVAMAALSAARAMVAMPVSITLKAQNGISLRQVAAFGGNGGNVEAIAKAGNGGDGRTPRDMAEAWVPWVMRPI